MDEGQLHFEEMEGPGAQQEVSPDQLMAIREKGESEYSYHTKAETHFWVVYTQHRASEKLLDNLDGKTTDKPILDAETMIADPFVGCMICEQSYSRLLRHRKCPGEPRPL